MAEHVIEKPAGTVRDTQESTKMLLRSKVNTESALKMIDQGLFKGTFDFHAHAGPDAYIGRPWDILDTCIKACGAGLKGLAWKNHASSTAAMTPVIQKYIDKWCKDHGREAFHLVGGVVLNYAVGGINPEAVRVCAGFGGKIVWLPTLDSMQQFKATKIMAATGKEPIQLVRNECVSELKEIFGIIADNDLVLQTGHTSSHEREVIIDEAIKAGVKKIVIDHPNLSTSPASIEEQVETAKKGVYVELDYNDAMLNSLDKELSVKIINAVGADHLVGGTDLGAPGNPHPVDGLWLFIFNLAMRSVSYDKIETIFKKNASRLLKLD